MFNIKEKNRPSQQKSRASSPNIVKISLTLNENGEKVEVDRNSTLCQPEYNPLQQKIVEQLMSVWDNYDEFNGKIDCPQFLAIIRKLK